MEESSPQESKQEPESKNQNEEEGGIRLRLRDRDLLRKRKAEAEEKETNQWDLGVESQRKRSRAENKSSSKKRGRPRKAEPEQQLPAVLEEAAGTVEVLTAPEPAVVISDQLFGSPTPAESQPAPVVSAPAPAPALESVQSFIFVKTALDPAAVQDPAPVPPQTPDSVSVPAAFQVSTPAAPPQVETLDTESQGREAFDQVLIEDLGPDEEEDTSPQQNKSADEGLAETLLINVAEQNKMFSLPTLSSPPLPQEYLPGN